MRASSRGLTLLFLAGALVGAGCGGPAVDLAKGLQIQIVSTGWFDAGIVNGKNKLVPLVSFTIKNLSNQKLVALQINASFHRANEKDEWGNGLVTAAGSEGLAAGATSATLTIKSQLGYTGTDTRAEMLENPHFVDATVKLLGKYGALQWTPIVEAPIARQLITP